MDHFVKCNCQQCQGHIEFDLNQFSPESSIVPCPHCGLHTQLYVAEVQLPEFGSKLSDVVKSEKTNIRSSSRLTVSDILQKQVGEANATGYQKAILRSLKICDKGFLALVGELQAGALIENSALFKELLRKLRIDGFVRQQIPADVEKELLFFTLNTTPTQPSLLHYIRLHFQEILLSENYGKKMSRESRNSREARQEGEFAPVINVVKIPPRENGEPDATLAQKRLLRDLGVRDEQLLAHLGKSLASDLIEKVLDERNKRLSS